MRPSRLLVALATVTALAGACGSDEDAADLTVATASSIDAPDATAAAGGTTADTGAPTTNPTTDGSQPQDPADPPPSMSGRLAPAGPDDVTGAADVAGLLAQLGFPEGFPVPEDLTPADVVGVDLRQSASDTYTSTTSLLAWRAAAPDDAEALAQEWYDRARDALGVPEPLSSGTITGNELEGIIVSGGEEDAGGSFSATVIRPEGDESAEVVIELRHEVEVTGAVPDLEYAPALADALPDLTGCVAEIASASFRDYISPNEFPDDPAYTTIFDGNCPTEAMDAVRTWAAATDGLVNDNEQNINVSEVTAPDGTTIQASAYLGDDGTVALRIDTRSPIG